MQSKEKGNLLVVDDSELLLQHIFKILKDEGYNLSVARNGHEAIACMKLSLPDLILLDVEMPKMDGWQTIHNLKSNKATSNIPIIFYTNHNNQKFEVKAFDRGAVDYIYKQSADEVLKRRVKTHMTLSLQNKELHRFAFFDPLTGVSNRSGLERHLKTLWRTAQTSKEPMSVVLSDIDSFKSYNDAFGHPQGDVALKTTGQVLQQEVKRGGDMLARWGGEEFIMLLPQTHPEDAYKFAERSRQQIENAEIDILPGVKREVEVNGAIKKASKLTASFGVASHVLDRNSEFKDLVSEADAALYHAKNQGRNQVQFAPKER